jgi:hypothetical protein
MRPPINRNPNEQIDRLKALPEGSCSYVRVRPACRLPPKGRRARRPLGRKQKKREYPIQATSPRSPNQPSASPCRTNHMKKPQKSEATGAASLVAVPLPCHHVHGRAGWRSQNLTVAGPRQTPSGPIPPCKACCPSCGGVPTPHAVMRLALCCRVDVWAPAVGPTLRWTRGSFSWGFFLSFYSPHARCAPTLGKTAHRVSDRWGLVFLAICISTVLVQYTCTYHVWVGTEWVRKSKSQRHRLVASCGPEIVLKPLDA